MGEGLAVEKKEIWNVSGSRGTKTRTNRDTYAMTLRYIYDTRIRASVSRRSHECRSVLFSRNLLAKLSQFVRNLFLFVSQIRRRLWLAETKLRWVCKWFATGSRHMR